MALRGWRLISSYSSIVMRSTFSKGRRPRGCHRLTEWIKTAYQDFTGETEALYRRQLGRDLLKLNDGVRQAICRLISSDEAAQRA